MINIEKIRKEKARILAIGSYPAILQSMLDFDYLSGNFASIVGIIAVGRRYERYFYGKKEIFIPVFSSIDEFLKKENIKVNYFLNLTSARRVLSSTLEVFEKIPSVLGGVMFAENVPEAHSIQLYQKAVEQNKFIVGPSSVGLLIPQVLKLGAIGGVDTQQLIDSSLFESGNIAVFSASGGMTGELIRILAQNKIGISFALSFGGDRFPILSPSDAFLAAQKDSNTTHIVYFGELGGYDEYKIVELIKKKQITKKIISFIAGNISEIFETPPQFGHAKAMASGLGESAKEKQFVLREAGVIVGESFTDFISLIKSIKTVKTNPKYSKMPTDMENRKHALISTSISGDDNGNIKILGEDLLAFVKNNSFAAIVGSLFLGKKNKSKEFEEFIDFVLRILVDHGPYVSGAVNTIVTARAGRDLVSALSSGLLTIGSRFGGAINEAANNWLTGVVENKNPSEFVEDFAKRKVYISGIGHRKYRLDMPDLRVLEILEFADRLTDKKFTDFAKSVEKVTTSKKANLILNIDGAIAAVLLDILSVKEGYSDSDLQELVKAEFFNALFVLSRSVGFIAHFLDQKRLDEGLFRLEEDMVASV